MWQSPIGQVVYFLRVTVPDDYPRRPPVVQFISPRVVMPCVDNKGIVHPDSIEIVDISHLDAEGTVSAGTGNFFQWSPADHNIADILVAVRNNMHIREICAQSSTLGRQSY